MNPGQLLCWAAFLAALFAALGFLAATGGRESALKPARVAFRVQWVALAAAVAMLWSRLFSHDFRYEYVATYTSRAMEWHYVMAGLWGGQEGTFLLWALITCTLGW